MNLIQSGGHLNRSLLLIALTAVSLFSHTASSAQECRRAVDSSKSETYPKGMSAEARLFWDTIGAEIKRNLDSDFQRVANKKIYRRQIELNHPAVAFYKSLGIEVTSDGTFRAPDLKILFLRLNSQISVLNKKLIAAGLDIQINPQLFLSLKNETFDLEQNVILFPHQNFSAPGFKLIAKGNILKTLPFFKFVGQGGFPIGGIESSSGLSRTMVEVEKITVDPQQREKLNLSPHISDFLHDLAHLSAFLRNPEFAAAYVRVFRSHLIQYQKLNPEQQTNYLNQLNQVGSKEWRRNFYFSESAWLVHEGYQKKLQSYPLVSSFLAEGESFQSKQIVSWLKTVDNQALKLELEKIRNDWWKLFDPMGGAVNDMISMDAFSPAVRSNFIVQRVLRELESYIEQNQSMENANQNALVIIFGLLKNSPKMTVTSWEYFARAESWKGGQVMMALKNIFPPEASSQNSDWNKVHDFLYVP